MITVDPCGNRRMLACCIGLAALVSGCENGCESGSDVYSLGTVILTGPSGSSSHVIDGNYTFAFPHRDLEPPSIDPPGTTHTLSFTHPSAEWTPRQEVIGFDLDYSEPLVDGPQPTIDYVPASVEYVSVLAGASKTYAFDSAPTAHVIRYWHGRCAGSTPWSEIFNPLSLGVFEGIVDGAQGSAVTAVERDYDMFQPYFIGVYDTIAHGFSFEATYNFIAGPLSFEFYMNPAYELHVRPEDGLMSVVSVHQGVIPSQADLQDALANTVPAELAQIINEQLTFSLENPVIATDCDPAASVSQQQEFCFSAAITGEPGYLLTMFELGFNQAGFDDATAEWAAMEMVQGLQAKNFACITAPGGVSSCAIHPVIERVNVLPDELEFVFVSEEDPVEMVFFYQNLPTVVEALSPETTVPQFCFQPSPAPTGKLPRSPTVTSTRIYDVADKSTRLRCRSIVDSDAPAQLRR
jgi:hypothetical protein